MDDMIQSLWGWLSAWGVRLKWFFLALDTPSRIILAVLLVTAAAAGFVIGRRRTGTRSVGKWRFFSRFQNTGEAKVSRLLASHFKPPDYHLMNHVTIRMDDGTTQIDHILVSRFGVYVIETKDYNGWIYGKPTDAMWTHTYFGRKFRHQNPIHQNYRHVCAVREVLDFLPDEAIKSVVVICGYAEFKTAIPSGVISFEELTAFLRQDLKPAMSLDQLQFCVGRLETARLAISRETDVEHVERLARRFGSAPRAGI